MNTLGRLEALLDKATRGPWIIKWDFKLRARIHELEEACRVFAKAINDVRGDVDWPELTNTMRQGLGCGVEDRGIHDRYEAAEYGYEDALERCADFIKNATNDAAKDPIAAKFIKEARAATDEQGALT